MQQRRHVAAAAATCNFSGDDLDCEGAAIVDGKIYEVDLTFK